MEKTIHRLINGDARDLGYIQDESIHLVLTSPPYWNLTKTIGSWVSENHSEVENSDAIGKQ
jgi:DNA modification methylase